MYCYLWPTKIIRVLYLKVHCKLHGQNDKTFSIRILPLLKKFTFSPDVYWGKFSNIHCFVKAVNWFLQKYEHKEKKSSWMSINVWNYYINEYLYLKSLLFCDLLIHYYLYIEESAYRVLTDEAPDGGHIAGIPKIIKAYELHKDNAEVVASIVSLVMELAEYGKYILLDRGRYQ